MTLPIERRWAVNNTRQFLVDLMDPNKTLVPDAVRKEAYHCLKHYPGEYHMEDAAVQSPKMWGEQTEKRENGEDEEIKDKAIIREAYKSRWRMASRFIYHTHTDLRSIAEAWCRERCEQHEWDVKQFTNTYEDTFRFEFEEHFKEFSTWYDRLDHN